MGNFWGMKTVADGAPLPCPDCPSDDFAVGATTLRGQPIVTCMGCGARWYMSNGTWRKPHPNALPAAWAQLDSLARMEKRQESIAEQSRALTRTAGAEIPARRRAAHEGFRRPPAVEDE
jgi:hypothetical protein